MALIIARTLRPLALSPMRDAALPRSPRAKARSGRV
jgi:hypothetical protein